jgi:hypothetical protein
MFINKNFWPKEIYGNFDRKNIIGSDEVFFGNFKPERLLRGVKQMQRTHLNAN